MNIITLDCIDFNSSINKFSNENNNNYSFQTIIMNLMNQIKKLKSTTGTSDDPLNSKTTINENVKNKKKAEQSSSTNKLMNPKNNLFTGYSFTFPVQDVDLSIKLTELLKKLIKENGGKIYQLNDKFEMGQHYYLVSKLINFQKLKKKINQPNFSEFILSYTFVKDSIQQGAIANISSYQIFQKKNGQQIKRFNEYSLNSQDQLKKKIKINSQDNLLQNENDYPEQDCYPEDQNLELDLDSDQQGIKKQSTQHKVSQQKMYNVYIIQQLLKLQNIYETQKDVGRSIAYLKAISAIRSLEKQITDQKDVMQLKGVGPKIIQKIFQILSTGKLSKVQLFQKNEKYEITNLLNKVWGIGPSTSQELFKKGIKTIEQLRKNQNLLNKNQKIGLKYFQEFSSRIPRPEVQQIQNIVKREILKLDDQQQIHLVQTCGSYRRGKQTCGDIDIIITRKDGVFQKQFLLTLIQKLEQIKLITNHLSVPKPNSQNESFSYMGVCQLNQTSLHRRLDIKYYPLEQFAYALLYFTGSDMFNRSMRLVARKKGYSLSDHGLCPVIRDTKANNKAWQGKNILCLSEEQIFKFLGLQYKSPVERSL